MNSRGVQNNRYDAKAAVLEIWVTRLAHVVPCESIFYIQVDIKDIMHITLLNDALKLFVFATNLLQVFWVKPLFGEVDEYSPAPVLLFHRVVHILDLDSYETPWDKERDDILRLANYFPNFSANLLPLKNQFFLSSDLLLLGDRAQLLELAKFFRQLCLNFGKNSFVLKLVETLHYDVFGNDVFNPHHIEQHVISQVERGVKWI